MTKGLAYIFLCEVSADCSAAFPIQDFNTSEVPTASVSNLTFSDTDVRTDRIAGRVRWEEPEDMSLHTGYVVYMASDSNGANRVQVGDEVRVGSNEFIMQPVQYDGTLPYLLVYTSNSLGDQEGPPPSITFEDLTTTTTTTTTSTTTTTTRNNTEQAKRHRETRNKEQTKSKKTQDGP